MEDMRALRRGGEVPCWRRPFEYASRAQFELIERIIMAAQLLGQLFFDDFRDKAGNASARHDNFLDYSRAYKYPAHPRHDEECFNVCAQFAVHERHLEFVFKIADGTKSS